MKKSKLSLISLLIISMLTSLLPLMTAKAALGVQSYMFADTEVRRGGRGEYVVLEDVDFSYGYTSFDLDTKIGWSAPTDVSVTLDGTNGTEIARWKVSDYSDYIAFQARTDRIELNQEVTGVHDLYFNVKGGEVQCYKAAFYYIDGSISVYTPYGANPDEKLAGSENLYKLNFLSGLGVVDTTDEDFSLDIPLTRINYLKALSGFYNLDELPEVPVDVFTDIKDERERKIAYFLYLKGAVVLEDTAYLKPYEYITPQEAAEYAANMLGYPGDLRVIAKLKAGKDSDDGFMRPEQMADILYNAAFHDYRVGYKTQSGAVWYEEYDSYFLNYTKKYEVGEGLVTANSYTGLYSAQDTTGDYQVCINDTNYNVGATNADEYLGIYVYYIYGVDDNGIETIHAIAPKNPDYITELDSSLEFTEISSSKVEYLNDKNKTKEIKLQGSSVVIYNGKALDVEIQDVIADPADFRGRMVAIDNNKDKVCDVLIISNAQSFVIGSVTEEFITSVDNPGLHNYTFEEDARVEFLRNGALANAVDFSKDECVDIYVSASLAGDKLYQIVYSPNSKEATLTGKGDNTLTFDDGTSYELYPDTAYTVQTVGDTGTFYINNFGEVVYFAAIVEGDLSIGWLYKVVLNDEDEKAIATIKTTDNITTKYQFAKKLYVEGVRIKTYDELKTGKSGATTALSSIAGIDLNEPVLFRVDENNQITIFDTKYTVGGDVHTVGGTISKYDSLIEKFPYQVLKWDETAMAFISGNADRGTSVLHDGMVAVLDREALVFGSSTVSKDFDTFTVKDNLGSNKDIYCAGYTIGKVNGLVLDILMTQSDAEGTIQAPFIIQTIEQFVDGYGEVKTRIKGVSASKAADYVVNNLAMLTDPVYAATINVMKPGDLVVVGIDADNNILSAKILHYGDNKYDGNHTNTRTSGGETIQSELYYQPGQVFQGTGKFGENATFGTANRLAVGTIVAINDDNIIITKANTNVEEQILITALNIVTVGDKGLDVSSSTSYNLLTLGQKVMVLFKNYCTPTAYFVFENMN